MAVTQEPLASQPSNDGSSLRISPENENDSHTSQIEGERTFLGWLILPLLSLCSCGRGEKNADEAEVIHPFPHTLNSPQCLTQPMARFPPKMESPIGVQAPPVEERPPIVVCEPVESRDYTTITRYEAYAGYGSEVRSGGDLTRVNSSLDNFDHLHLIDLPLLPLLTICEFLFGDGTDCRDIYHFRNTCRSFAAAVNAFFQNPTKIPQIDTVKIDVMPNKIELTVWVPPANYFCHPTLSEDQEEFYINFGRNMRKTEIRTTFYNNRSVEEIERVAKMLRGPSASVAVHFDWWKEHVPVVLRLLANVSFDSIYCSCHHFNTRFCDFLLSLLRNQSKPNATISVAQTRMCRGGAEFLTELDSLTRDVRLWQADRDGVYTLLNLSSSFWKQWLLQKVKEGYHARYDDEIITAHTDLTASWRAPKSIEWREGAAD